MGGGTWRPGCLGPYGRGVGLVIAVWANGVERDVTIGGGQRESERGTTPGGVSTQPAGGAVANGTGPGGAGPSGGGWSPWSWQSRLEVGLDPAVRAYVQPYADAGALRSVVDRLAAMPPLVTSFEVESLRRQLAEAEQGRRFVLWGGDCAEALADCRPDVITGKLKVLLQMSLVLVSAGRRPVVRVGRLAGQYAKPRSSATETRVIDGASVTLPSYFGDLVNRAEFTPAARRPDPELLLEGYKHAAMTLNFVRSLLQAGFADVQHPEYWDLGLLTRAGLTPELRERYQGLTRRLADGLEFMQAVSERSETELLRAELYTSHEGLNLDYEAAQTRTVPRRQGHYLLSTHLPWIGERTRRLDGPHVEYFRGVRNPVGVKLGPKTSAGELLALLAALNPCDEPGKVVLMPRLGVGQVEARLPGLVQAVKQSGRRALWVCDPMHGNGLTTPAGIKTRLFEDIRREAELSLEVHRACGSHLGGLHVELTGEDVTECLGGAAGINESDLTRNYLSACDPRLNYEQAMELAFALAAKMER